MVRYVHKSEKSLKNKDFPLLLLLICYWFSQNNITPSGL